MFVLAPTSGPGIGLRIRTQTVPVIARAAFIAGDLAQFDLALSDGDVVDNNIDGGNDSGFANIVNPTATTTLTADGFEWFCIVPEAIADNAEGRVVVASQKVNALLHTLGGGSITIHKP